MLEIVSYLSTVTTPETREIQPFKNDFTSGMKPVNILKSFLLVAYPLACLTLARPRSSSDCQLSTVKLNNSETLNTDCILYMLSGFVSVLQFASPSSNI